MWYYFVVECHKWYHILKRTQFFNFLHNFGDGISVGFVRVATEIHSNILCHREFMVKYTEHNSATYHPICSSVSYWAMRFLRQSTCHYSNSSLTQILPLSKTHWYIFYEDIYFEGRRLTLRGFIFGNCQSCFIP